MIRRLLAATAFAVTLAAAGGATAGQYGDSLSKCLVRSAGDADKRVLTRWIFATMALHDDVRPLANISDRDREEIDRQLAKVFERLITEDCRAETVAAMKYEGVQAFQNSFGALGEVAMTSLMESPKVGAGMEGFTKFIDEKKLEALGRDMTK